MTVIGHLPWLNDGNGAQPSVCSIKCEWRGSARAAALVRVGQRLKLVDSRWDSGPSAPGNEKSAAEGPQWVDDRGNVGKLGEFIEIR